MDSENKPVRVMGTLILSAGSSDGGVALQFIDGSFSSKQDAEKFIKNQIRNSFALSLENTLASYENVSS